MINVNPERLAEFIPAFKDCIQSIEATKREVINELLESDWDDSLRPLFEREFSEVIQNINLFLDGIERLEEFLDNYYHQAEAASSVRVRR
ncbi:MAG: hypothetical protein ACM3QZ_01900 [Solirubrobacterales bacterium]